MFDDNDQGQDPVSAWEEHQEAAAAREAAAIGGRAGDANLDPAQRPLIEAGEGVSEGFELAEAQLIEASSFGGERFSPFAGSFGVEAEATTAVYGDADHEACSELRNSDG